MSDIVSSRTDNSNQKEMVRPWWTYMRHKHSCSIFGRKDPQTGCDCGLLRAQDQIDELLRRAAELLYTGTHPHYKDWYDKRNQWLRDAGVESTK